jgi:hypothetical protein
MHAYIHEYTYLQDDIKSRPVELQKNNIQDNVTLGITSHPCMHVRMHACMYVLYEAYRATGKQFRTIIGSE